MTMAYNPDLDVERGLPGPAQKSTILLTPIKNEEQVGGGSIVAAATKGGSQQTAQSEVADMESGLGRGHSERDENGGVSSSIPAHPDMSTDTMKGIPQLAAFLSRVDSFAIYPQYKMLQARVLLHQKMKLDELQARLLDRDKQDSIPTTACEQQHLGDANESSDEGSPDLLDDIRDRLHEYYDLLLQIYELRRAGCTPARDHESLTNWILNQDPVPEEYQKFLSPLPTDFVSLSPSNKEKTWLVERIEDLAAKFPHSGMQTCLESELERELSPGENTRYYSPNLLKIFERLFYILIVTVLLLLPIVLMSERSLSRHTMTIMICCFVVGFEVVISIVTDIRPQEMFIGTAAYGAMLVAFLSNFD
ncbi:hypothetical protein PVAG01_09036 [Phlyctema vagabunda]|uniref:DUF6594 domain-containing protein n=1 Tax=Phlyctema vagabunda TaxID=108571 RepID=A0ABR4P686_9HELO